MRWFALLLTFQQALWIDVPFIRQDKNGCGSAAIWMVMKHWQPDREIDVDRVQRQLYSSKAGGIYAKDMARYLESQGYRTFVFRGDWSDLQEHIAKGRPLIVCLERNSRGVPLHYVVVAGIDPIQNLVLINDPADRKLLPMARADFERYWQATDNWTLLAVPEIDLASTAFREEKLSEAREHLASAVRLSPSDTHANDFLATVYFLQDNTEAALKYWNRLGKPQIENVRIDPPLTTDPVLLDRALGVSRGSVLNLPDFETSEARLNALGVFSRYRIELSPSRDDRFDLTFRAAERRGTHLLSWARGLPFETIQPEFSNIGGKAINVETAARWDRNKRRAFVSMTKPLNGNPKWSLRTSLDARDENWTGSVQDFRMRRVEAAVDFVAVPNGRWTWSSGTRVSNRDYSNEFSRGTALKYVASATRTIVRDPAKQLRVDASLGLEAGKLFGRAPAHFGKLEQSTLLQWRFVTSKMTLGTAMGDVPLDERFILGLDRDTDLWLRAHRATTDGRKNQANTTRNFLLTNTDIQKKLFSTGWLSLGAGPFLDTGKAALSDRWLFDTGLELRLQLLGALSFNISYGRSPRDGSHALFARVRD